MRQLRSVLACGVLLCLLVPSVALSQPPRPTLDFKPGFRFLAVGHVADVEVRGTGLVDLYGCEVTVRYDPRALEVQDADPDTEGVQAIAGDVFTGRGTFVALNAVDVEQGTIRFAAGLVEPAAPIQGSATFLRIGFKALRPGPTMLRFGPVILVNVDAQTVDARLVDGGMWLGPIR